VRVLHTQHVGEMVRSFRRNYRDLMFFLAHWRF